MRRRLALYAMFALFACAWATQDRLPNAAARLLRGAAEHVIRAEEPGIVIGPEA